MPLKAIRDKVKLSESTLRRIWPLPKKIQTLCLLAARLAVEDLPQKQDHPEGHEEEAAHFPHHYCQAAEEDSAWVGQHEHKRHPACVFQVFCTDRSCFIAATVPLRCQMDL